MSEVGSPLLVFNIRPASPSDVRAMDRHEKLREPDGTSAIDPARRDLNRLLHGSEAGPLASLNALYSSGVRRPSAQAEAPYLSVVLGASSSYFRPGAPDAAGTWDRGRLDVWVATSMRSLQREFGADLIHVALHMDEDTPHMHALVAPTYGRAARKPGRKKRGETDEAFAARVAASQASETVRTVGRSSHPVWAQKGSFEALRRRFAGDVADLGIGYGQERGPDAPPGISTREWVRQEAARLSSKRGALEIVRQDLLERRVEVAEAESLVIQDAFTVERERRLIHDQARNDGLAEGRKEAALEVRALRRELHEMRDELVVLLKAHLPQAARPPAADWIRRLDALADRLKGWMMGSGSRRPQPSPEPEESPSPGPT